MALELRNITHGTSEELARWIVSWWPVIQHFDRKLDKIEEAIAQLQADEKANADTLQAILQILEAMQERVVGIGADGRFVPRA